MIYKKAFEIMLQGGAVRLPDWKGFWVWDGSTVMMCCGDGDIVDMRDSDDVVGTLSNVVSNDWIVADDVEIIELTMYKKGGSSILTRKYISSVHSYSIIQKEE